MYNYEHQKRFILTDDGQRKFLKTRDHVNKVLERSGVIEMGAAAYAKETEFRDSWEGMAFVDRMVELGELIELSHSGSGAGQHRVFRKPYR